MPTPTEGHQLAKGDDDSQLIDLPLGNLPYLWRGFVVCAGPNESIIR